MSSPAKKPEICISTPIEPSNFTPIACETYELYWRLGYGPPGGDKLDKAGWDKYFEEMPEYESYKMSEHVYHVCFDDEDNDNDESVKQELWVKFREQFNESEGFDIEVYPTDGCGVVQPSFNDTSPASAETYQKISDCARIAVDAYNQRAGTDYTVNRVVKACSQLVAGMNYYITFEAINSKECFQVFQAKVYAPLRNAAKVVSLVRPKA